MEYIRFPFYSFFSFNFDELIEILDCRIFRTACIACDIKINTFAVEKHVGS